MTGTHLSLQRLGPSCSFLFPLNSASRTWLPVSLGQGTCRQLPATAALQSAPRIWPSCCLSSRWDHDPSWLVRQAHLQPTLQVVSPQPLIEDRLAGPFPRHGWFCLLVLNPRRVSPSACVLRTHVFLPFLGPFSKNCFSIAGSFTSVLWLPSSLPQIGHGMEERECRTGGSDFPSEVKGCPGGLEAET